MDSGLYGDRFSEIFDRLLKKGEISRYSISTYTGIDQAYLSRLRSGERSNPSPETLIKIGLALSHLSNQIEFDDIETLFNAAGRTLNPTR